MKKKILVFIVGITYLLIGSLHICNAVERQLDIANQLEESQAIQVIQPASSLDDGELLTILPIGLAEETITTSSQKAIVSANQADMFALSARELVDRTETRIIIAGVLANSSVNKANEAKIEAGKAKEIESADKFIAMSKNLSSVLPSLVEQAAIATDAATIAKRSACMAKELVKTAQKVGSAVWTATQEAETGKILADAAIAAEEAKRAANVAMEAAYKANREAYKFLTQKQ